MKIFKLVCFLLLFSNPCFAKNAYHIGNSLVNELDVISISNWAISRGHTYDSEKHVRFSSGLNQIWNDPDFTNNIPGQYGKFTQALPGFDWDVVTLEAHFDMLEGTSGSLSRVNDFVNLMLQNSNNIDTQVYIYQVWPFQPPLVQSNYTENWHHIHNESQNWTFTSRDYYDKLLIRLDSSNLNNLIKTIPTGEVFFEIDQKIRNNEIELSDIHELYRDQIHLSNIGNFVLASTVYSTIFGENPVGLSNYVGINSNLTLQLQSAVWQVVAGHLYSGVPATGDYNGDGNIDSLDYNKWLLNYSRHLTDASGYTAWRDKYSSGYLESVLESSSIFLFIMICIAIIIIYRN